MTKSKACRMADKLTRKTGSQWYVIFEPTDFRDTGSYVVADDYDLNTFYAGADDPVYAGLE